MFGHVVFEMYLRTDMQMTHTQSVTYNRELCKNG